MKVNYPEFKDLAAQTAKMAKYKEARQKTQGCVRCGREKGHARGCV